MCLSSGDDLARTFDERRKKWDLERGRDGGCVRERGKEEWTDGAKETGVRVRQVHERRKSMLWP